MYQPMHLVRRRHRRRAHPLATVAVATALLAVTLAGAHAAGTGPSSQLADFEGAGVTQFDSVNLPNPNPYGASINRDCTMRAEGSCSGRFHTGPGPGNQYARGMWGGYAGTEEAVNWSEGADIWYGGAIFLPVGFYSALQGYLSPLRWDNYSYHGYTFQNVSHGGLAVYSSDMRWRLFRQRLGVDGESNILGNVTWTMSENQWHWIEVHQRFSRSDGQAINEVYVDGARIGSSSTHNFYGDPIVSLRAGIVAIDAAKQTKPLTLWMDRTYMGPYRLGAPAAAAAPTSSTTTTGPSAPAPTTPPTTSWSTQPPRGTKFKVGHSTCTLYVKVANRRVVPVRARLADGTCPL